jgi:hypothetical protein
MMARRCEVLIECPSSYCVYCTPIVILVDIDYFSCRALTFLFILERPRVLGLHWHGWRLHIHGTRILCVYHGPMVILDGKDTSSW